MASSAIFVATILIESNQDEFLVTLSIFAIAAFRLFPSINRIISGIMTIKTGAKQWAILNETEYYKDLNYIPIAKNDECSLAEIQSLELQFKNSIKFNNVSFRYANGSFGLKKLNLLNSAYISIH